MADGYTKKNIEDVEIGEMLLGQNGVSNKVIEFDHPQLAGRDIIGINGLGKLMTPEHPLYTKNGWRSYSAETFEIQFPDMLHLNVKDLEIGDEILMDDVTWTKVESLEVYSNEPDQKVYNFILDGNNTYFANGFLAHNRDGPSGPDPIAQMFTLPQDSAYNAETSVITSVDLWFSKVDTRASMNQVKVEIRKTYNGYPGGERDIIGKSLFKPLRASDETATISDATAVNFEFTTPVVLRDNTEYAIVIKSPSDIMSCWVAQIGEPLIDGTGIHTEQPFVGGYFGSFFTSQNASTWNAEQNKDLTYRLYRARFDTNAEGVATLVTTPSDVDYHLGDIGAYNQGLALETFENSPYVKVHHPNHGFHYNNAQVTISGVKAGTYNSIPDSDLNGTFAVYYPTLHSYFIKTATNATVSGKIQTGIFTTFATQDIVYDSLATNFMIEKEEVDAVSMNVKTTITAPVNLAVVNNKIANESIITPYADDYLDAEIDRLIQFEEPRIVRSATNSTGTDLTMQLVFGSGTEYTSPIMKTNSNMNPIVFRNITGYLLTDSDIEGLTTTSVVDSDVDDVKQEYVSYLAAVQSEKEHSAYVTDQIDLEIPADGFTIKFDADMAPSSSVEVSYKIRPLGDDTPFEELEWQDFPYAQQVTELNYGEFKSMADKKAYTLKTETPFEFASFKIRMRLRTKNEAYIPQVSDLRIIADI